MGKINEIEKEKMQSYGSNALTTVIEDEDVIFDAKNDKVKFADDVKFEGKLLKKRGDQPIYDEIAAVDYVSSYTTGTQIGTLKLNGVNKPIYVRDNITLAGTYSSSNTLQFKVTTDGKLQCSFDKGQTWKNIMLTEDILLEITPNSTWYYFDWPTGVSIEKDKTYTLEIDGVSQRVTAEKRNPIGQTITLEFNGGMTITYDPTSPYEGGKNGAFNGQPNVKYVVK